MVDIPLTGAAQANFLGLTLCENRVAFFGDVSVVSVSIIPPSAFHEGKERYDIAVNIDSFTEMSLGHAQQYWDAVRKRSSQFLSINHEFNPFTMRDL